MHRNLYSVRARTSSCWVQGEQRWRSENQGLFKKQQHEKSQSLDGRSQFDPFMFLTYRHRLFLSELPKEKNIIMLSLQSRDGLFYDPHRLPIHLLS